MPAHDPRHPGSFSLVSRFPDFHIRLRFPLAVAKPTAGFISGKPPRKIPKIIQSVANLSPSMLPPVSLRCFDNSVLHFF
jgi:hypothetical protein